MPRDKRKSHERVIKAAKQEFLKYGFEKASMRRIGELAGMTSAGLYRHYINKEDMFNELVAPAINEMSKLYNDHIKSHYENINLENGETELFSFNNVTMVKEVLYKFKDEFTLILNCSQGTKYENFVHEAVMIQERDFIECHKFLKDKGLPVRDITNEELHVLLSAYTTAIFEPIVHNWSLEKALHTLNTVEAFFIPGWKKLMGF